MNRRQFLYAGAASLTLPAARTCAEEFADQKPRRVGLIGCAWYGKVDLFRLIQVAPFTAHGPKRATLLVLACRRSSNGGRRRVSPS